MKALSIKQPWAWLIVNGYKTVENRNWNTKLRGEFLIHAGKEFDLEGYDHVMQEFPIINMPLLSEFDRGGIVGKAFLINTVHISESRFLTERDVDWFYGEYGFILDNPVPLRFTPMKGQLGFFNIDQDIIDVLNG